MSASRPSLAGRLRETLATFRHYHEVAEVGEIARRYFAMNAFDGVLTAIGVLAGAWLGGVEDVRTVVVVVLTTAVGMAVSGFYGSYLVERAERERSLHDLESSTLSDLGDSTIAAASRYAAVVIALVDGSSPAAAALVTLVPFLFAGALGSDAAYLLAFAVGLAELFGLGAFLGAVSRQRLWPSGLKLVAAGAAALVISLLLGGGVR